MSSGTGPRWPSGTRASRTRSIPMPVRCATGTSAQGAGAPGRQVGGRGITCGGTGRDIGLTLTGARAAGAVHGRLDFAGRHGLATLSPHDVPGGVAGSGRRVGVVPHHRPGQRRRHQGHRRAADRARDPPRRLGPQRARHRRLGREVLLPGRAGRGEPGGGARPLRVGRRLRGAGGPTGPSASRRGSSRTSRATRPTSGNRTCRGGGASSSPPPRSAPRWSRSWPTSRPSTSTGSGSSTSCSTSACCTT